jgi:hypothetical protein
MPDEIGIGIRSGYNLERYVLGELDRLLHIIY